MRKSNLKLIILVLDDRREVPGLGQGDVGLQEGPLDVGGHVQVVCAFGNIVSTKRLFN